MTVTTLKETPQKFFLINRSDLIGRFDAPVYQKSFFFTSKRYKTVKLPEIAFINPHTSFEKLNPDDEITFIPMEAVDENLGTISEFHTKKISNSKGFTRFQENDLIWAKITPCMQNGKSAIVTETLNGYACGSTEFYVIRPKNGSVLVKYLHFILRDRRILESAKNYFGGSAGQQRVAKEFLLNLKLPLPDIHVQESIVSTIEEALINKKNNNSAAIQLLSTIDTYILSELGVSLPEKETSLSSRIFTTVFSEVAGVRFDPLYFKNKGTIESYIYENNPLKKITIIKKGQSITKEKITKGAYPVIAGGQTSPYSHNQYNFKGNIITVSASGAYSGFVWYHNYPIFASDCIVLQSKNEKEVSTQFIYYVMKALQQEIYKLQQGAGQPHVYSRDLEKIIIPTPPLAKQKEMLKHINHIHTQIKKLQSDAIQVLETAKQEVEEMILG